MGPESSLLYFQGEKTGKKNKEPLQVCDPCSPSGYVAHPVGVSHTYVYVYYYVYCTGIEDGCDPDSETETETINFHRQESWCTNMAHHTSDEDEEEEEEE